MPDWGLGGDGQRFEAHGLNLGATSVDGELTIASATILGGYGAWVTIPVRDITNAITSATTTFDAAGFIYTALSVSGMTEYAVDIGVGPADPPTTIVQRLYVGSYGVANGGGHSAYIPLAVPAGSKLWARICGGLANSGSVGHTITMCGQGWRGAGGLNKCVTYNMTGTVLNGTATNGIRPTTTNYSDPGDVAGVYSNVYLSAGWLGVSNVASPSTTVLQYPISMALFCFVTNTPDATMAAERWYVDIGIGSLTAPTPIIENIIVSVNSADDLYRQPFYGPVPLSLPAGTLVVARCITNIADLTLTHRAVGVALYGFS